LRTIKLSRSTSGPTRDGKNSLIDPRRLIEIKEPGRLAVELYFLLAFINGGSDPEWRASAQGGKCMQILFASAEIYPLAKTGGLADVSAALPQALVELGADVRLIMPAYPQALAAAANKSVLAELPGEDQFGPSRLIGARMPDSGLPIWLLDCPSLYDRPGTPYLDQEGRDWPDNAQRFAKFCRMAAQIARGEVLPGWHADVVHANDWHTGLLPLLLGESGNERPATIFTIHNLAYQGLFPRSVLPSLGVPDYLFTPDGIEFFGQVSFMKAGIRFSDWITTVSPSYAREILSPEYGCGLDGLLRRRVHDMSGILNGVDYRIWDPWRDPYLPAKFRVGEMAGKRVCKAELQLELGLEADPSIPIVACLSRITEQKMADVVCDALHMILDRDVQFALLGQGDPRLEARLRDAAQHYPGRLAVRIGYDEVLAHRLQAGADLLLHPARYEPCGLTPLYAMRYGTLPIVRHVGGLVDTIVDATEWTVRAGSATGFAFRLPRGAAMLDCLDRALAFYAQPSRWRRMQRRAMSREFGWDASARRYLALYRKLAPNAAPLNAEFDPPVDPTVDVARSAVIEIPRAARSAVKITSLAG
jgi:starch synthase